MSFCPSKDIHSIYLDNEMPSEFRKNYEEHLNNCPKCQKELELLKAVHNLYAKDSKLITPNQEFLDESFERLQLKLKFSKNTSKTYSPNHVNKFVYAVSAAAAVLLAAVLVPLRVSETSPKQSANASAPVAAVSSPYARTASSVSLGGTGKGRVISGNIHESMLSSDKGNVVHNISSTEMAKKLIDDVDIIRPDLGDNIISIRITIPGMNSVPFTTEIELPANVISGLSE